MKATIDTNLNTPKYHVETFPIGSCICNSSGYNCLKSTVKHGGKFTTLENAIKICKDWNTNGYYIINGELRLY